MATGLKNKLTGQIGEFLACAELGRRGLIATSFTGNVPEFDLIICDGSLRTLPAQIKTSRGTTWPSQASHWLNIEIDDPSKQQINHGRKDIEYPDLIYICISLADTKSNDRFFICTKRDIQDVCITAYKEWMNPKGWIRPINHRSLDNRFSFNHLIDYENNWQLIFERLEPRS